MNRGQDCIAEYSWDRLPEQFDTSRDEGEIAAGAADNILIAWPVILRSSRCLRWGSADHRAMPGM
ncbi:MAG TPA: hypothetical protein VH482_09870 [Thermomicrobiales bacterium]